MAASSQQMDPAFLEVFLGLRKPPYKVLSLFKSLKNELTLSAMRLVRRNQTPEAAMETSCFETHNLSLFTSIGYLYPTYNNHSPPNYFSTVQANISNSVIGCSV